MFEQVKKISKTGKSFSQGLIEFMRKYSVLGLAIGVITAQASKDLVDSFVKGVFTPAIKFFLPDVFDDLRYTINGTVFDIGIILSAALTFIIVMVFLYFVIKFIIRNDELLNKK
ncbi:MAG: MscL family protein [Patescibacteria group bacterium]|nr:MAG: MscL family protein [Patescibacteria group bacterium]